MTIGFLRSIPPVWKIVILGIALAFDAAVIPGLIYGPGSIYTHSVLKEKRDSAEAELAALNKRRTALSREIRLLKTDSAYVEKIIRQRGRYVKKNEILYVFDNQGANSVWTESGSGGLHE
ncbi:MAG: septum formation initiator family protein [Mailhella sp.]|nr:septum formation initiator family protein [Mailhella sp.]